MPLCSILLDSIKFISSQVQWDAAVDAFMHPERVCPWWIEPLESATEKHFPVLPNPKRPHLLNQHPLPGLSVFGMNGQYL